jgi:hypothetical protein
MKHFGREEPVMLKSTPLKVPAAGVAELVPSFTTTETVAHQSLSEVTATDVSAVSDRTGTNEVKKQYKTKKTHFKQT